MYYVYILESIKTKRWYIGSTEDPDRRLIEHNAGKHRSNKGYRPYQKIHIECYLTKQEARHRENTIKKSGRIRKELKEKIYGPIV